MPKVACSLCGTPVEARTLFSGQKLELPLFDLIKRDRPDWSGTRGICTSCHDPYRAKKLLSYFGSGVRQDLGDDRAAEPGPYCPPEI